jgi:two-component system cell cycle response regulator DivK
VYQANTAEAGLQAALEVNPDLLLLDLGLPDHDGLTLAGWIREKPDMKSLRIVAYTAWPEETAKKMAESYGCDGFISKPIQNIRAFADYIEEILRNK